MESTELAISANQNLYISPVVGEEEGEGHIAGATVGLHEGIEVVAGVIEGAGPSSGGGDVVAEVVGEE